MNPSVVIPCWINDDETWKITANCVDSFRAAGEVELILVDNGSKYGAGYLRANADLYIRHPENRGYTVAINDGIKVANGELVAWANNDIRVAPNWIEVTEKILRNNLVATVHPKMLDYETPFSFGELVAESGKERWCQNSFVVTTAQFLKAMAREEWVDEPHPGLFDEGFGIGGGADDWDFGFRVRKLAYQCYTNKTCFQHQHSFSLQKLGPERGKVAQQNDEYFTKKHGRKKEEWFTQLYPEQMQQNWKEGFV